MSARPLLPLLAVAAVALALAPTAAADLADETALAERFAPVVRLVEQEEECGPGEPYEPMDVDALFGDSTVALRGPWNAFDLVKIGPTAETSPGSTSTTSTSRGAPSSPAARTSSGPGGSPQGADPAIYAHVASEATAPRKLALQYWFFYAFNDFNNTHEGDWEMIQLVFDADDAADALDERPVEVGYSSHEGAEKAAWDDDKLEIVGGTHPVVYPAAGSHANKFTDALYLGSSAEAGRRLRRHARAAPRDHAGRPDDPERRRGRRGGVPVDHVRGTVGRAAEGLLQRADRPQHEDAVADADRVVGGLARSQLRRADRGRARDGRHRLLLLRPSSAAPAR